MRLPHRASRGRAGYTLIELLVVIAIIAILVGLTAAGIFKYLNRADEVTAQHDITQLSNAMESFKARFKLGYPPDRLLLSNNRASYNPVTPDDGNNALRQQSLSYLHRMFPRLDWSQPIDWTGAGNPAALAGTILEGDQCLVFFLGGIQQSGGGSLGFSTNPRNPTQPGGDRIGPFFDGFKQGSRLYVRSGSFLSYKDPWLKEPYIYFSSNERRNGYIGYPTLGVTPYFRSNGPPRQYENASTFQIISAGADGTFGPGGLWNPATGVTDPNGKDDRSNFNDGNALGAGGG